MLIFQGWLIHALNEPLREGRSPSQSARTPSIFCPAQIAKRARCTLYLVAPLKRQGQPDNAIVKRRRIIRVAREHQCETFVETGTFYGQTLDAVHCVFSRSFSCELSARLFELNFMAFRDTEDVRVLFGDSADVLRQILPNCSGRILFWLDGHYSGGETAIGSCICPALMELDAIKMDARRDHCILIDDARLFTGSAGYPSMAEVLSKLREINSSYVIELDGDCLTAVPKG
jgi:hypothetical protein